MSDQRPSPSPSSPQGRGLRIAALLTFAAGLALAASPATAKRPSVTRNRGFSAEAAQVYTASKTNKKRRGRKGKKNKKKRRGRNKGSSLASQGGPPCTIGTDDLIHQQIDVSAQTSLMRKMSGSAKTRTEASSIYHAIEDGTLAGIYLPPRKVVSDRGRRMSPAKGYWQMIPSGKLSACITNPQGEPPMIVYREKLSEGQIDVAISSAWKSCGLPLTHTCTYDRNLERPAKNIGECDTDEDCLAQGQGNRCDTNTHTCYTEFPDQPLNLCVQPRCHPGVPATVQPQCGVTPTRELLECLPVVGDVCGVCENGGPGAGPCHKKNERRHKKEVASCKADHSPTKTAIFAFGCLEHMAKCVEGDAIACAKSLPCLVDPKPVREYQDCLNKEAKRYLDRGQKCTRQ